MDERHLSEIPGIGFLKEYKENKNMFSSLKVEFNKAD